jgi:hypothetical protein
MSERMTGRCNSCNRRDKLGDLGIDGSIILKWTLEKQYVRLWTGFIWLMIGTSGGLL